VKVEGLRIRLGEDLARNEVGAQHQRLAVVSFIRASVLSRTLIEGVP
jgi:hypothetical protein